MCAAIVHAHGGTISLEDSGLPGANFVVRLPSAAPQDGNGSTAITSISPEVRGAARV
jgi:K+-sensing histidine kinase KdpD